MGKTEQNLKEAIAGETHEFKKMYPAMIEVAKAEGQKAAERSFSYANAVEKVHADLYQKALDKLEALEEVDYYICSVCGASKRMFRSLKWPGFSEGRRALL